MKNKKIWAFNEKLISTYKEDYATEECIQRVERYTTWMNLEPVQEVVFYRLWAIDMKKS